MSAADVAGIVTGSVGAVTGVGGLVVATLAERRAGRAERAAAEASAGADSVEQSLQRIADNLERDREQRERAATLWTESGPSGHVDEETGVFTVAGPAFSVEFAQRNRYRLRNVGTAAATNVTASLPGFPEGLTRDLPAGIDLSPLASTPSFLLVGSWQTPLPGELTVTCNELPGPIVVPMPARP